MFCLVSSFYIFSSCNIIIIIVNDNNDNNNIDDCNDNEIQCGLGLLLKDKSTGNHINCSFKNPFK